MEQKPTRTQALNHSLPTCRATEFARRLGVPKALRQLWELERLPKFVSGGPRVIPSEVESLP